MMNDPVKMFAILAGVLLLLSQFGGQISEKLGSFLKTVMPQPVDSSTVTTDDLSHVLRLTAKLRATGNEAACKAAKALLDALITPEPKK